MCKPEMDSRCVEMGIKKTLKTVESFRNVVSVNHMKSSFVTLLYFLGGGEGGDRSRNN